MLFRQLPALLLLVTRILDASSSLSLSSSSSSFDELCASAKRLFLEAKVSGKQPNSPKLFDTSLTTFEISKKGRELAKEISSYGVDISVKTVEQKLFEMVHQGISLSDIVAIVGTLVTDQKRFVLAAIEKKMYTVLSLLQSSYIWHTKYLYHWFKAQSYESPWYDKDTWDSPGLHAIDWEKYIEALFECDNGVLVAAIIHGKILFGGTLKCSNEEFLNLCIKHDAVNIFKSIGINFIQTNKHLGLFSKQSSVRLLKIYQESTKIPNLHLERFSFPEKLPVDADDFRFLMNHGFNCFPMETFIRQFCKEGRLDLLKYLYRLNGLLVPDFDDLIIAAEAGCIEVIRWILSFKIVDVLDSPHLVAVLAINGHFQTLEWFLNTPDALIDGNVIKMIIEAGNLEALCWIDKNHPLIQSDQEWADLAAEKCHLPIIGWLHGRFGILPKVESLGNATVGMLEWIKTIDKDLINEKLIDYGASNFELLKWVFANIEKPLSIFKAKEVALSKGVRSKKMLIWLDVNFKFCSFNMNWAYEAGDLKVIKWAWGIYKIYPTEEDVLLATKNGHLHLIEWIHGVSPELLHANSTFPMHDKVCIEKRLGCIIWAREHNFTFWPSFDLWQAAKRGELKIVKWFAKTFPDLLLHPEVWTDLARAGHYNIYSWLLRNYPKERQWEGLYDDLSTAYARGNLGIVRVIIARQPSLAKKMHNLPATKKSFHVKKWLLQLASK